MVYVYAPNMIKQKIIYGMLLCNFLMAILVIMFTLVTLMLFVILQKGQVLYFLPLLLVILMILYNIWGFLIF